MSQDVAVALLRAVEHNLIGGAEAGHAAGLAALLRVGHTLTVAQTGQAARILSRHAEQLAAAGIEVPTPASMVPAQAQPGPDTPVIRVRWITTNAGKETERRESRLAVANAFRFKDALKKVADAKPHKDDEGFVWHYSPTPAAIAAVMEVLGAARPVLSDKASALLEAFHGQGDARAVLDETAPLPDFGTAGLVHDKFDLWGHQRRAVEFAIRMTASLLALPMGPQPVDTPVLTPKGWRQLGDLAAGDEVFDANGEPVAVKGTRNFGTQPVFRVALSDGTSTRATAEHRWQVRSASQRCTGLPGRILTTRQMIDEGLRSESSRNAARFFLPDAEPVWVGVTAELPVPPYALGVLLGDGALGHGQLTVTCPDDRVIGRLCAETSSTLGTRWRLVTPAGKCQYVRAYRGELYAVLARFGLTGRSESKAIPEAYLLAEPLARLDLLRGLMDTDGSGSGNARAEFSSASPMLASQVAWLARSLGAVVRESAPRRTFYRDANGERVECLLSYRVTMAFQPDSPSPFMLERKTAAWARGMEKMQRRRPPRSVRSIEPDGVAEVCCIELDVEPGQTPLYLTDRALIPTHNSGKTLSTITLVNRLVRETEASDAKRVLIVCPNSVRGVWPREVRKFSAKRWHIVNGMKPSRRARKGVVDIAGAANRLAEAEHALFDCRCGAEVHAAVVNYDILAREPWKSWHPSLPIDLLVYDEIHKLKAHGGQISKTCAKWVSWSRKRVGLSGTPMPQTPLDVFGVYRALDPAIFGLSWTLFRSRFAISNPHIEQQVVGYRNMAELAKKFFSIAYRPTIDLDLPPVVDVTRECVLEPDARKIYDDLDNQLWAEVAGVPRSLDPATLRDLDAELDRIAGSDLEDWRPDRTGTVTPANIMVKLLRLQQLTGGTVIDDEGTRVRVSHAKQNLFAEVLDEVGCARVEGAEPEPVIVFCRFRSDLDAVAEVARARGLTYGEVSGRSKTGLTADSEMADYDVVGVQIQSGGTGVDLTRARVGIWYSLGYSLSDYDQARKRMDRPGQTRSVTFVHLLAQDTADADVYAALDGRRSVIHGVMEIHEIDASKMGFREEAAPAAGEHGDGKAVAVTLPFEALLAAENARIGEPMRSSV